MKNEWVQTFRESLIIFACACMGMQITQWLGFKMVLGEIKLVPILIGTAIAVTSMIFIRMEYYGKTRI